MSSSSAAASSFRSAHSRTGRAANSSSSEELPEEEDKFIDSMSDSSDSPSTNVVIEIYFSFSRKKLIAQGRRKKYLEGGGQLLSVIQGVKK